MTTSQDPSLDVLADSLVEDLDGVTRSAAADITSYARGSSPFARASSRVLEVCLPEDIADAALRTPDTSRIPDEPGWIRFAPASAERHVADRAEAWFLTGWRHSRGST